MKIWTVGYGGRSLEAFLALLKENKIQVVADVRSNPYSRFEDYNRERLEQAVRDAGLEYVHLGNELGGTRDMPYERHMGTPNFKEGIEKLMSLARQRRVAIMCAEKDPASCHRRYIADHLAGQGVEVVHIMEGTSVQRRLM